MSDFFLKVDLQNPHSYASVPSSDLINQWVRCALQHAGYKEKSAEITVRIVNAEESQQLNRDYRAKDKPTNVLSFPFEAPPGIAIDLLGDLVICHSVLHDEAEQQNKKSADHWAHLIVHGTLHLLGFDHIEEEEADEMEALEVVVLSQFEIEDPYL
ncbi:MAG: rRNA maturation RNase YbeY [Kangiellaceae bacterium]|nr:rRNA maturation RNase YbeY [Kangiellaceae bacterium]MCW8999687.1 rRNA maturation RNase YbeY [Kangiellaceae bacterium]MCW9016827.1 rRNA maturation RNase YbeY [Kangiellaceae bacterium]